MGSGFRTFQSGEVLTAANVQNYLMDQSVMVFAGTAARSSAIGTATAETGMVTYRTDGTADAARQGFEFWDGSAWTRMLRPVGLEFITSGSFSGVASWSVDNVFTSDYRNYRIVVHNDQTTGAAAQQIATLLRVGAVDATTAYYNQRSGYNWTTGVINADVQTNGGHWFILRSNGSGSIDGETSTSFDVYSPALAVRTLFNGTAVDGSYGASVNGYHDTTTAYDGIKFAVTTGATTMTGTYRIYGYRD